MHNMSGFYSMHIVQKWKTMERSEYTEAAERNTQQV